MNRRRFTQSLVAAFSLPIGPIFSFGPRAAALPSAAAIPKQARFWAIYMSGLHGECSPQSLQNLMHIPEVDAKRYISQLIADGVVKPTPALQNSVRKLLKSSDENFLDKFKKRIEMKTQAGADEAKLPEVAMEEVTLEVEPASADEPALEEAETDSLAGDEAVIERVEATTSDLPA